MLRRKLFPILLLCLVFISFVNAQNEDKRYILGEEQTLQILVYILGEVDKPGEYIVSDQTNIVELLAKAGGSTDFSNLGNLTITREKSYYDNESPDKKLKKSVIKYDVSKYLKGDLGTSPPVLQPGDVVYVGRNNWSRWRSAFTVVRDLSVIASAYFLYERARD